MTDLQDERVPSDAESRREMPPDKDSGVQGASVAVDLEQARTFLRTLDPVTSHWHFRTFPDRGCGSGRSYSGTFDELALLLQLDNGKGCGVFVVINEGGHKAADITRVRAVFADFDDPQVIRSKLSDVNVVRVAGRDPHLVVESSPGKLHFYWRVDGLPVEQFTAVQQAIAARLGADPSVADRSRVMRLPGFIHHKGAPCRSQLRLARETEPAFTGEDVVAAFPTCRPVPETESPFACFSPNATFGRLPSMGKVVTDGRHDDMRKMAAQLARKVVFEGWREDSALVTLTTERDKGRWAGRDMPNEEIRRALQDGIAKCRNGQWKDAPSVPGNEAGAPPEGATSRPGRRSLNFRSAADLIANPKPLAWLIRQRLEQNSLALVFGDPGTGKSFLAMDWAACVATSTDWFGCKVAAGPVFYIAGEGGNGMGRRFRAWELHKGVDLHDAPLYVSTVAAALTDREGLSAALADVQRLIELHGAPRLIVLDTLARNFGPGDENKTQDMTSFVDACDRLREETGACVLIVHHSGHGDKSRARGSIVMKGALDWEYRLTAEGRVVTMENVKAKDAEPPAPIAFHLTPVDLGICDEEGQPVTSAALSPAQYMAPSTRGKLGRGKNQTLALRLLKEGLKECADRLEREGEQGEPWVSHRIWLEKCEACGLKPRAFNDVVKGLAGKEIISIDGDRVSYDEFNLNWA